MERLNNDQQIEPLVAQFVPVKLDVSSDEFQRWERAHPSEGNSIPKLYVIRADGESLYAQSGSLKGDALPEMLTATLRSSGRILDEREIERLLAVTSEFQERIAEDDISAAIKSLNKLKKLGEPGRIESFASAATELNQLVGELATGYRDQLTELKTTLDSDAPAEQLPSIIQFLQLRRKLTGFKFLKSDLAAFQKRLSKGAELRQLTREARIIDAATNATSDSSKARTLTKLSDLLEKTEIEAVRKLAKETLEKLTVPSR